MKLLFAMLLEREPILELQVYYYPRHYGSGPTNKIFDVDIAGEAVLLEPAYPIVLETTGDQLVVGTEIILESQPSTSDLLG